MISVPNNTTQAKATSLVQIAGPRGLVADSPNNRLYAFDGYGALQEVDLTPAIPCGNIFNFTGTALNAWGSESPGDADLQDSKDYTLRRAANEGNGGATWRLTAYKKIRHITLEGTSAKVRISKTTVCAKAVDLPTADEDCCVRKQADLDELNPEREAQVQTALVGI